MTTGAKVPKAAKKQGTKFFAAPPQPVLSVAERTMADILEVATEEFARDGLSGARIDEIAARTKTSKRMIYYYFGSKEGLYLKVLEAAFRRMHTVELGPEVAAMSPDQALRQLVRSTFHHYHANPDTIRIVMNENLHHAAYLKRSQVIRKLAIPPIDAGRQILERGTKAGVFRAEIEPVELYMTISALCFHHVANRYSFSTVFNVDMASKAALQRRAEAVAEVILAWVGRPARSR